MNKTPIQELIWLMSDGLDNFDESVKVSEVWDWAHKYLEKEKQFAFDCFEAGRDRGIDEQSAYAWGDLNDITTPEFEQFYSQYAEQHKK